MARASNVYVVVEEDYSGDHVMAAFTVKHECKTWLQRNPRTALTRGILRVSDGVSSALSHRWTEEDFLAA